MTTTAVPSNFNVTHMQYTYPHKYTTRINVYTARKAGTTITALMSDNAHNKQSTAGVDPEVEEEEGKHRVGLVWPCGARSAWNFVFASV